MLLKGKVHPVADASGYFYVEIPALDIATQGSSIADAKEMARDAVQELIKDLDPAALDIRLIDGVWVDFHLEILQPKPALALMIRNYRARSGMSVAQYAEKLGEKSKNGPFQYEQARAEPSFSKFQDLLLALGFDFEIRILDRKDLKEVSVADENDDENAG